MGFASCNPETLHGSRCIRGTKTTARLPLTVPVPAATRPPLAQICHPPPGSQWAWISNQMRLWTIHLGEQLPTDTKPRLFRNGLLASAFAEAGHSVVQWAPTFSHLEKKFRCYGDKSIQVSENLSVQLVESGSYKRNISIDRAVFHRSVARNFLRLAKMREKPDVIFVSLPTPEMCGAAIRLSRDSPNLKVIIDIQDLWPDVYLTALPKPVRALARPALRPLYDGVRRALESADALTAVSASYMDWATMAAPNAPSAREVFPLGYRPVTPLPTEKLSPELRQIVKDMHTVALPLCYVGQFSHFYDLETVIEAARLLEAGGHDDFRLVLCGGGSDERRLRSLAAGLNSIHFTGWLDAAELASVMSASSMGIISYSTEAPQSLPNKPFEYMAYGLGLISNLRGELSMIIKKSGCGYSFDYADPGQLAEIVYQLCIDRTRVNRARAASAALFKAEYDSDIIYPRMVRYVEGIASIKA